MLLFLDNKNKTQDNTNQFTVEKDKNLYLSFAPVK